jgi:uncharacterized protein
MSTMTPTSSTLSSIPSTDPTTLLLLARQHSEEYMSQPHFDASHDWTHVQRVVALAQHILRTELASTVAKSATNTPLSPLVVELAALLHDVGDHKYTSSDTADTPSPVQHLLSSLGAADTLAQTVQEIVSCVSYSHEVAHPERVQAMLKKHPELGIVQDADRLDALGAVGVARLFAFGGARQRGLADGIKHVDEKLLRLEGMMKTAEGKRLARERTARVQAVREWWTEEADGTVGLTVKQGQ